MIGACMFCASIKNEDIFDRCIMTEYIKIINLRSFQTWGFFVTSQHDLCFMLNRTIKKGLVYRLKSLRALAFYMKLT